jgi:(p)ppGpp synthase/HD superfamily hydrolase
MKTLDLEWSQAEVEVRELEARLRVVPINDAQLLRALRQALEQKRGRLQTLRAGHGVARKAAAD